LKGLRELADLVSALDIGAVGRAVVAQLDAPRVLREPQHGLRDGSREAERHYGRERQPGESDGEQGELEPVVLRELGVEITLEEHGGTPVVEIERREQRDIARAADLNVTRAVECERRAIHRFRQCRTFRGIKRRRHEFPAALLNEDRHGLPRDFAQSFCEPVVDPEAKADPCFRVGRKQRYEHHGKELSIAQCQPARLAVFSAFGRSDELRQIERRAVASGVLAIEKHLSFKRHEDEEARAHAVAPVLHRQPHRGRIVGARTEGLFEAVVVSEQTCVFIQFLDAAILQLCERTHARLETRIDLPQRVRAACLEDQKERHRLQNEEQREKHARQPAAQRAKTEARHLPFRVSGRSHRLPQDCAADGTPA
jgi:hypothetical protein